MLELTTILKEHGLKVTPQRLAIFKVLKSTDSHPSAESIYNELLPEHPSLSLATVYKTLDTFEKHGLVIQLNVGEDSARYDSDVSVHSHIKCTMCNTVRDYISTNTLEKLKIEAEKSTGFAIETQQVCFYGICPECQHQKNS